MKEGLGGPGSVLGVVAESQRDSDRSGGLAVMKQ